MNVKVVSNPVVERGLLARQEYQHQLFAVSKQGLAFFMENVCSSYGMFAGRPKLLRYICFSGCLWHFFTCTQSPRLINMILGQSGNNKLHACAALQLHRLHPTRCVRAKIEEYTQKNEMLLSKREHSQQFHNWVLF